MPSGELTVTVSTCEEWSIARCLYCDFHYFTQLSSLPLTPLVSAHINDQSSNTSVGSRGSRWPLRSVSKRLVFWFRETLS